MSVRRMKWLFWSLTFLGWFPIGFLIPVLVLTLVERGVTLGQVGLIFACYGATTALLELPTGGLADQIGRKPVLMMSAALNMVMALGWLVSFAFIPFLIGAVIGGIGRALSTGPLEAWFVDSMGESDPDEPIRPGLAGAGVAGALGVAVSSLGVAGLTFLPGLPSDGPVLSALRLPPLLAALFAGVYLLSVWSLMDEPSRGRQSVESMFSGVPATMKRVARIAIAPGSIRLLFAAMALLGVGMASLEMLYQPFITGLLDSTREAARLFGFLVFGLAVSAATGSALASLIPEGARVHPAAIASVTLAFAGLGIAGFGQSGSVAIAAALFLAIYVLNGFGDPFLQQILHAGSTSAERSTMVSAGSLTVQSGVLITGTVIAQIAALASIPAALGIAGIAMLTASLLMLRVWRAHPKLETLEAHADVLESQLGGGT